MSATRRITRGRCSRRGVRRAGGRPGRRSVPRRSSGTGARVAGVRLAVDVHADRRAEAEQAVGAERPVPDPEQIAERLARLGDRDDARRLGGEQRRAGSGPRARRRRRCAGRRCRCPAGTTITLPCREQLEVHAIARLRPRSASHPGAGRRWARPVARPVAVGGDADQLVRTPPQPASARATTVRQPNRIRFTMADGVADASGDDRAAAARRAAGTDRPLRRVRRCPARRRRRPPPRRPSRAASTPRRPSG